MEQFVLPLSTSYLTCWHPLLGDVHGKEAWPQTQLFSTPAFQNPTPNNYSLFVQVQSPRLRSDVPSVSKVPKPGLMFCVREQDLVAHGLFSRNQQS